MTTNGKSHRTPRVAIIGAGISGICMGYRLKRAGIEDFTIYERAPAVGGTWWYNHYPGLTCDVPSRFYQYTFSPNPEWTRWTPPQHEIWQYFVSITRKFDFEPNIHFNQDVVEARWEGSAWRVRTRDGEEAEFDFLISAVGVLRDPNKPDFEGMESFAGAIFHSAEWDDSVPLEGRRIAVIGTGSTGVQLVGALADVASRLLHFQRTTQWVLPLPNWKFSRLGRWMMRRWPKLGVVAYRMQEQMMGRFFSNFGILDGPERKVARVACRLHLSTVRNPELRAKVTPDYAPGCKRLVMSTRFYPAIQRDHVEVIREGIERIEPHGIRTTDGVLHEVDVIVLATGFQAHNFVRPINLVGRDGRTLDDVWPVEPKAYRTVALPGFPNFFMFLGPLHPLANVTGTAAAESVSGYVMKWIEMWTDGVFDTAAPTDEATEAFNARVRAAFPGEIVWATGGCDSWYIGKDGIPNNWPWPATEFHRQLRVPQVDEFELR
jgi:cation diffusion facilitator CzcD-associated flavoprotein CzcO